MKNKLSYTLTKGIACIALSSLAFLSCNKEELSSSEAASARAMDTKQSISVTDEQLFIVDQFNTATTSYYSYNIYHLRPVAQEFVPDLHALDAVELVVEDASCSLAGSNGGELCVRIRDNDKRVLGISAARSFPNCFVGKIRFDFDKFIPLEPGKKYIIEPLYISGNTSCVQVEIVSPAYLKGNFILSGVTVQGSDLWFREGLYHAVARNKEQARNDGWRNLVRKDGTVFKNQGDCIQYINTGK